MKRKHIETHPDLYRCRTWFFWNICSKCKQDFRREEGYKCKVGPYVDKYNDSVYSNWIYLCQSCAPSFEVANKYFLNREYIPEMPNVKPPKKSGIHIKTDIPPPPEPPPPIYRTGDGRPCSPPISRPNIEQPTRLYEDTNEKNID